MSKQIGVLHGVVTVLAAAAFVATWSSGFIIAAIATVDVSPLTLLVWRFVPLAVVLLALVLVTGAGRGVAGAVLRRQAAVGLFAQFGYCASVYAAIAAGVATGTTALIDAVQPLVVAILVGPLLGLRVRGIQWAGLVVGAAGVLLVVRSQLDGSGAPPAAYLLPALAMACLIVGTFIQRRSASAPGVLLTLTVHVGVAAIVLVVIAASTGTLLPPASASFWLAAVLAAVFPTLSAYGLYWWLLRRVGITALNALLFLVAPATAGAGAVLFGEPLTGVTLAGFVLCGAGVAAVLLGDARAQGSAGGDWDRSRHPPAHPRRAGHRGGPCHRPPPSAEPAAACDERGRAGEPRRRVLPSGVDRSSPLSGRSTPPQCGSGGPGRSPPHGALSRARP
ncbi:drug/metabolite transporter (DMT)-like permease [Microbacterium resistens]|uniref:Drug/metabolite transporter (DMT)-like permease n=1 Tax=Microbacterium resistens TaxID=156977 RepID=A0ABU1SD06_9MICO|nr:DMT family transporter [Microbacterium resistens]MDR6867482.1 drug/metabolite transporter (DMT)-like permease [Microbacterium resistens]